MRRIAPFALLACAGCASSPTPGSSLAGRDEAAQVIDGGGGALRIHPGDAAATTTVPATIEAVLRVLPAVFDTLGIPVNTLDTVLGTFGNSGFKVSRKLGSTPLSRYIDCGQTQAFASADTYEIHLSVMTQLHKVEVGTTIATVVQASGRPVAIRGDYTRCSSKGELERRIADLVKAKVRG